MRLIAILAAFNEERFITASIDNLVRQGAQVYLIDNSSTDRTVEIAQAYRGRGVVGIETVAREGVYHWSELLKRKEQLAATLDADWFMHVDADEVRLPPRSSQTLLDALSQVDAEGYNAVNFIEYTFMPTRESPDHDHPNFQQTMHWYYPFLPVLPNRLNAWKRQPEPVELAWSGGHLVRFPDLRMYPESFKMKHYLYLSIPHVIEKYVRRVYDASEVEAGWHGWRARVAPERIVLPSQQELRTTWCDDDLDPSNPRRQHYLAEFMESPRPA